MKILLAVTGGIAAYKSLEICRLLKKASHDVQVVMTSGAKAFIQPLSFQALSGHPVRDSLFDANQEAGMGHIELARWADAILVAPASADSIAKFRLGVADDLLSTLMLATDRPIFIAPAMNRLMWANAATQENIHILQQRGMKVLGPDAGEQACGEVGAGRMREPALLVADLQQAMKTVVKNSQDDLNEVGQFWQGKRLLVTAGPTFEDIDPVRFLGNRSSGKMGYAIAEEALALGANVELVSGPVRIAAPAEARLHSVRSAEQMFAKVKSLYADVDVMIAAAAVADFRSAKPAEQKIKKQADQKTVTLELVKNPDIIAWVAQQADRPYVVGFAAETQNVLDYAQQKLRRKKLDMICANQVGENLGFDEDQNQLTLITQYQQQTLALGSKLDQAKQLLSAIALTANS